jgi:hypothetical protein
VSVSVCRIIPTQPDFVPSAQARERAAEYVRTLLPFAEDVTCKVTRDVCFVDCGENFESVRCPRCGADLGEWWAIAMEAGHEQRFADLRVTTLCCGLKTSLNELEYAWPSGLARCVIEALEPGVGSLPVPSLQRLRQLLQCDVRVIWAHYS